MNGNRIANTDGLFDTACRELRFQENKQPLRQIESRKHQSVLRAVMSEAFPSGGRKSSGSSPQELRETRFGPCVV